MLDYSIFRLINSLAPKNAILDFLGIFFAQYFIWLLFFIIIIFGLLPPTRKGETLSRANTLKSIVAALLAWLLAIGLSHLVGQVRPFITHHVNLLINPPLTTLSFPSRHTAIAFAFSCTLFLFRKKIGFWFLTFALLIGLARIFVGVHYPSDILAGALLGCLSAIIIKKLTHR